MRIRGLGAAALVVAACGVAPAAGKAAEAALSGEKVIYLQPAKGAEIAVGRIAFQPAGDGARYRIVWEDARFSDQFLSMRPFKCLEGPAKLWCRVPYPYAIKRRVSAQDLTDLEYDLLFVWKGAGDYGINMWNGVYYRLSLGPNGLTGRLQEIDLDVLAAPPPTGELRPIAASDLEAGDPDSHWLPRISIR